MKVITVGCFPHLVMIAGKYIPKKEEIRYDYQASNLWWRKDVSLIHIFVTPL